MRSVGMKEAKEVYNEFLKMSQEILKDDLKKYASVLSEYMPEKAAEKLLNDVLLYEEKRADGKRKSKEEIMADTFYNAFEKCLNEENQRPHSRQAIVKDTYKECIDTIDRSDLEKMEGHINGDAILRLAGMMDKDKYKKVQAVSKVFNKCQEIITSKEHEDEIEK